VHLRNDDIVQTTAFGAALARAAHRRLDDSPLIFDDPYAADMIGPSLDEVIELWTSMSDGETTALQRSLVNTRSRRIEDRLREAAARDVRQYVILGAGLDSFAYRNDLDVDVFEIDLASAQTAKRARVAEAGIPPALRLACIETDFESESLDAALRHSRFRFDEPAFVSWSGVTMYLSLEAIESALRSLATLAPGTEVVVSYVVPPELCDPSDRALADFTYDATASLGEHVRTFFRPDEIEALLWECGFGSCAHFGRDEAAAELYFRERTDGLRPQGLERTVAAIVRPR
jgi:methyltransferase (TIGR00027 family)